MCNGQSFTSVGLIKKDGALSISTVAFPLHNPRLYLPQNLPFHPFPPKQRLLLQVTSRLLSSYNMTLPAATAATIVLRTGNLDAPIDDIYRQLPPLPDPLPKLSPDFIQCFPPQAPEYRKYSVFLAGSIEMGKAIQWQKQITKQLQDLPITICNPRRGFWDPTVTPEEKDLSFQTQVKWELGALESASLICFFFDTNTKSPVTMLELGLWARSRKVIVCCNKKFHRAGNVHITCRRYGVPFVQSFEELVPLVRKTLWEQGLRKNEEGKLVSQQGEEIENKGEAVEVAAQNTGVLVGEGGQCSENNLEAEIIDPFTSEAEGKVEAQDALAKSSLN